MESYVTIKNLDDEPFIGKYDGEYITIPGPGSKIVQWDVMVVWMGDPYVENDGRHQDRRATFNRLCTKYHARGLTGNDPSLLPNIEAYTEDGERIITVLDDPDGDSLVPDPEAPTDAGRLQRQIDRLEARLQEQIAGLEDTGPIDEPEVGGRSAGTEGAINAEIAAERARETGEDPAPPDDDELDIPADEPTKVPVGRQKRAAKKAPVKAAPRSKPRGTAGTAGRRATKR